MKPIEECPVCHVPVRWVLHDGLNSYDCSNKKCPIEFTEQVWFPDGKNDYQLKEGEMRTYSFDLDGFYITVNRKNFYIERRDNLGDNPIILENPGKLPWDDLELLKNKIKIWVTFS